MSQLWKLFGWSDIGVIVASQKKKKKKGVLWNLLKTSLRKEFKWFFKQSEPLCQVGNTFKLNSKLCGALQAEFEKQSLTEELLCLKNKWNHTEWAETAVYVRD